MYVCILLSIKTLYLELESSDITLQLTRPYERPGTSICQVLNFGSDKGSEVSFPIKINSLRRHKPSNTVITCTGIFVIFTGVILRKGLVLRWVYFWSLHQKKVGFNWNVDTAGLHVVETVKQIPNMCSWRNLFFLFDNKTVNWQLRKPINKHLGNDL